MKYVLDAWLERRNPRLRILEGGTGIELAVIEGVGIRTALERFDVSPNELLGGYSPVHALMAADLVSEMQGLDEASVENS